MKRNPTLPALALAAVVVLAGCGAGGTPETEPEQTMTTTPSASAEGTDTDAAEHNDADVMFAQGMIPHHQQAVEMSDILLAKEDIDPAVSDLAMQIKDAQTPEIDTMTGWLEAWGEPVEMGGGMEEHDMDSEGMEDMDGMMSEDQMAEMESAEGAEAAGMFLEQMTVHHEGAVEMARHEIENGSNPEAIALAEEIVETQQAEIEEMNALLEEL